MPSPLPTAGCYWIPNSLLICRPEPCGVDKENGFTPASTSHHHPNLIVPDYNPAAPVRIAPGEILTLTKVALGALPES